MKITLPILLIKDRMDFFIWLAKTSLFTILFVMHFGISNAQFSGFKGPNVATINTTVQYSFTTLLPMSKPKWTLAKGTLVSSFLSADKKVATANVKWTQTGAGSIMLKDGVLILDEGAVIITADCQGTSVPGTPAGMHNIQIIANTPQSIMLTPGQGSNTIQWFEQGSAYENLIHTGTSFTMPPLSASKQYKVRSHNTTTHCVSPMVTFTLNVINIISLKQEIIRTKNVTSADQVAGLTEAQKTTSVKYIDGLSRQYQIIMQASSPSGYDVVQPVVYDENGLTTVSYLPYVASTMNGSFQNAPINQQSSFYNNDSDKVADDSHPFAKTILEPSPLGRLKEKGNTGAAWQPGTQHTQRLAYTLNGSNEVRKFNTDGSSTTFFDPAVVTKTSIKDADNKEIILFKDLMGRTLLKQEHLGELIDDVMVTYLETYYIYDEFGQIRYIISPKGVVALKAGNWSFTTAIKNNYTHQFVYDKRGRLIEKKVPGQAWMYYGYDKMDRLVLMQDGHIRQQNIWFFFKYDRKERPVMQGLYKNSTATTRASIQALLDGLYMTGNTAYPANTTFETRGNFHGYTNKSFPKNNADNTAIEVWNVNYYDTHDFDNASGNDYLYAAQGLPDEHTAGNSLGLPTGSKRIVLDSDPVTWLATYVFYDEYARPVQVRTNNHLNPSAINNLTTSVYDFEGKVLIAKHDHNAGTGKETTVVNKYTYDIKGRLLNVKQNNNGIGDQTIVQYEYNELGQVVDKKLHNTGGSNFVQSIDYRYSIRGWLESINNSELTVNDKNDDTNDYFGMELLYNTIENGLNNNALYNGNVSAVKWKGIGSAPGDEEQSSYRFSYDNNNKLVAAEFQARGTSLWNKEAGSRNETMQYDHNGNIKKLQRYHRKHQLDDVEVSYVPELMDNLNYVYNSSVGDQLLKVTDAAITAGFNNGSSGMATDYIYDGMGNILSDKNKGIDSIHYNALGKVRRLKFNDGRVITYFYDAGGSKLKMKTFQGTTLLTTTDYVNGFVYENNTLSFFGMTEGRVVKNGSDLEYQYAIADHQGNTRVVFSSVVPAPVAPVATFEGNLNDGSGEYLNVNPLHVVSFIGANQTTSGSKVVRMNQTYKIGPAKSLKVYPGDKVDMEVWEYHEGTAAFGTGSTPLITLITSVAGAFGGASGASGESGAIYNGVDNALTAFGFGGNQGDTRPAAYLNYILFDKDYNVLDVGAQLAPATTFTKQRLSFNTLNIKEAGFVYVYLSYDNNSNNWVHFDDLKVTHTKTNIIQYNEYYPYGLQTSRSWTRENTTGNDYLYNAGAELNNASGWYETFFRGYDPSLGRFLQIDPKASEFSNMTPYQYALNNPIVFNDPLGDRPVIVSMNEDQIVWRMPDGNLQNTLNFYAFNDMMSDYIDYEMYGGYSGPGSGSHWSDAMSSKTRDYWLMNNTDFQNKHGQTLQEYKVVKDLYIQCYACGDYAYSEGNKDYYYNTYEKVDVAQQGPVTEWWSARADTNVDYFGMKVIFELPEKTIITKTVAILTYKGTSNTLKSVTGIKIVTTVNPDGSVNHQGFSLPVDNNGKVILPEKLNDHIKALTDFWRPKSFWDRYWDFVVNPVKEKKQNNNIISSQHR